MSRAERFGTFTYRGRSINQVSCVPRVRNDIAPTLISIYRVNRPRPLPLSSTFGPPDCAPTVKAGLSARRDNW
jgi:hypothetical protein